MPESRDQLFIANGWTPARDGRTFETIDPSTEEVLASVMINEYFSGGVGSPFGGYKQSGFGREKGLVAIDDYTQIKNVVARVR